VSPTKSNFKNFLVHPPKPHRFYIHAPLDFSPSTKQYTKGRSTILSTLKSSEYAYTPAKTPSQQSSWKLWPSIVHPSHPAMIRTQALVVVTLCIAIIAQARPLVRGGGVEREIRGGNGTAHLRARTHTTPPHPLFKTNNHPPPFHLKPPRTYRRSSKRRRSRLARPSAMRPRPRQQHRRRGRGAPTRWSCMMPAEKWAAPLAWQRATTRC
jgi:hypothetical protein